MLMLSRPMVRALADAEVCKNHRGLERLHGGYYAPTNHPGGELHHHRTIGALLDRGYLQHWGGGRVVHITEGGECALVRWREEMAARAAPTVMPSAPGAAP